MESLALRLEPEEILESFNNSFWKLYKRCEALNITKYNDKFIEIAKRSFIAELFYKKYMISISGTQGVGKTTMIQNLYNIPEDYLPIRIGRCEQIPVIITEKDTTQIICQIISIDMNDSKHFSSTVVSKKKFHDGLLNPRHNEIYYELIVPFNIFRNEDHSFVLMPGIEDNNTSYDNYNRYVLQQTANSIYMFTSTKMAQMDNKSLLEDIVTNFKDTKPLFALSFSDQDNRGNDELKKRFMKDYNIEEDRVIKVGSDSATINIWKNELLSGINKYSEIKRASREKQLNIIDEVFSKELNDLLNNVEMQINMYEMKVENTNDVNKVFNEINKKSVEVESQVRTAFNEKSTNIRNEVNKEINKKINEENPFIKAKKTILGKSVKEMDSLINLVIETWKEKENKTEDIFLSGITSVNKEHTLFYVNQDKVNSSSIITKAIVDEASIDYYSSIFGNGNSEIESSKRQNMRSLQNIPYLANELIRMKYEEIYQPSTIGKEPVEINHTIKNEKVDFLKDFQYASDQRNQIIKGVAVFMGIDAIDGTVESIPAILELFGIEVSAAVANTIFAGVGLGILAVQINKKVNMNEYKDRNIAKTILETITNSYYKKLEDQYNFMLEKFYEQLRYRIEDKLNIGVEGAKLLSAKIAIADTRSIQSEVRMCLYEHPFHKK